MNSTISPTTIEDTRREILRQAGEQLKNFPGSRVRCEVELPGVQPLEWLNGQQGFPKTYWKSRDELLEYAGAGAADYTGGHAPIMPAEAIGNASAKAAKFPAGKYFGYMRFDPQAEMSDMWNSFGSHRFSLAEFECTAMQGGSVLAYNYIPSQGRSADDTLRHITAAVYHLCPPSKISPIPRLSEITNPGEEKLDSWCGSVDRVLSAIKNRVLEKAVLSRKLTFTFEEALNPLSIISRFRSMSSPAYFFSFQQEAGTAFLGSSPERLYQREGRDIQSEALAGTRPRGKSPGHDAALEEDLTSSFKDSHEHFLVYRHIRDSLGRLCDMFSPEHRSHVLKLVKVQHLLSTLKGRLKEGITDADIFRALHPTPAVAGVPVERAVSLIREIEGFDRGLFCGPVGWISSEGADFAVGIRSGHIRGNTLTLFSGAGIVDGSVPAKEWDETSFKFQNFLQVIGLR